MESDSEWESADERLERIRASAYYTREVDIVYLRRSLAPEPIETPIATLHPRAFDTPPPVLNNIAYHIECYLFDLNEWLRDRRHRIADFFVGILAFLVLEITPAIRRFFTNEGRLGIVWAWYHVISHEEAERRAIEEAASEAFAADVEHLEENWEQIGGIWNEPWEEQTEYQEQ